MDDDTRKHPDIAPSSNKSPASQSRSVDSFLAAVQRAPDPARAGRLLFALDATMSRQPTWDHAIHIQSAMFAEAASVNGLAMKLVYFRGFDECRASAWQTDGAALARLMQGISCLGGRTQIGRVLGFVRKELHKGPVPAVIYIGDAVEEDGDRLAQMAGEIGLLGCKIFAFHEGHDAYAGGVLRSMAANSGGGYFRFDGRSADVLKSLLTAVARYASGGRAALEASKTRESRLLLDQMR